jgi:diguanylate cyclase (GGDEF)-like protein
MFDAENRLMVFNRRYIKLYGLDPEQITPGMSLRSLLECRAKTNTFIGETEKYAAMLGALISKGETYSRMADLPDGRTISIVSRPMACGGWVVTHEDITERRRAEKKIAHMAHHDALTDLPNRLLLRGRLAEALANLAQGERVAVFYLDLDNFKSVNDTLGHQIGDELLKSVAQRLLGCADECVTVARVGGDEFALILPRLKDMAEATALASRICEAVRAPCDVFGHAVMTETSIGVAIAPDDAKAPDELLRNADTALYRAKANGRGSFVFFEPEMDASIKARRELESELRLALAEGQFTLHYQPILNLNDSRIPCCEALIRWNHPRRGLVRPGDFIPVAEEIGLIVPIGEWVLRQACADAVHWPGHTKVAVNLSAIQVASPNLLSTVIGALAASGLSASRLELEITESVMMQNTQSTLATLHRLRALDVKISMDDFDTGFSSLSYLRRFPFDKLKIDRSFIHDLSKAPGAFEIVRAVTDMARSLGMIATAEGVETAEQMEQVRELGCTEVQGYYIGKPQPLAEVAGLLDAYLPRRAKSA